METKTPATTTVGYWTEHNGWVIGNQATCETCGWSGTKGKGWQVAANELTAHRENSRVFVPVERDETPGVVYAVQDENYDSSGLDSIYASLYAALVAHPYPWLAQRDDYWVREDGDAIKQSAMSITRMAVKS